MKNDVSLEGDVGSINIVMKDGTLVVARFDSEDVDLVQGYRWHAAKQKEGYRIVCHMRLEVGGAKKAIYLHRLIMGAPADKFVDHINCDPSDNRKCNLRLSDHKANGQNRKSLHSTNRSGVPNVYLNKKGKWDARIKSNGKVLFLGYFDDISSAAEAVKCARAAHMPYSQEAHLKVNNARPY